MLYYTALEVMRGRHAVHGQGPLGPTRRGARRRGRLRLHVMMIVVSVTIMSMVNSMFTSVIMFSIGLGRIQRILHVGEGAAPGDEDAFAYVL